MSKSPMRGLSLLFLGFLTANPVALSQQHGQAGVPRMSSLEQSLSRPEAGPAALGQGNPSVAWNGEHFLVAWEDYRRGALGDIYAARVSASGELLDPTGIRISTHRDHELTPAVGWAGTHWVVAWNATPEASVRAVRVSVEGIVQDSEPVLLGGASPGVRLRLVSNGSMLLLTVGSGPGAAVVVDSELRFHGSVFTTNAPFAAAAGDEFLLVYARADGCGNCVSGQVIGTRLRSDGRLISTTSIVSAARFRGNLRLASDGVRYLLAWDDGDKTKMAFLNSDATLERMIGELPALEFYQLFWTGSGYLVLWRDYSSPFIRARRISREGVIGEPVELLPASGPAEQFSAAFSDAGMLMVWSAGDPSSFRYRNADIAGMTASSDLGNPRALLVSGSARRQAAPAVATTGDGYVTVWEEYLQDQPSAIHASIFSSAGARLTTTPIVISSQGSDPSVASDGATFFAVWNDDRGLVGRSFPLDGTFVNPEVELVSRFGMDSAVTWSGTHYLVVWTEPTAVMARRFSAQGVSLDPVPIQVSPPGRSFYIGLSVIAVGGHQSLVVWTEGEGSCFITCPGYSGRTGVFAARVFSDGTVLDPGSIRVFNERGGVSAASTGSSTLVVATQAGGVRARMIDRAGRIVGGEVAVTADSVTVPVLAWDGTSFLLATTERETDDGLRIVGRRLNENGVALENAFSFPIQTLPRGKEALVPHSPAPQLVANGPSGFAIAYTRVAYEPESGGVTRGFLRVFRYALRPRSIRRGASADSGWRLWSAAACCRFPIGSR